MINQKNNYDFLILGAGIVGLTIARELKSRFPDQSILILEKELMVGLHSSGRNSGVLHSGIYYPPESYKAKFCSQGRIAMTEFCLEHKLPFREIGKILIPTRPEEASQISLLYERGGKNGVVVERLNKSDLSRLEPEAQSATGDALFVPVTSIANPKLVIKKMAEVLTGGGVTICYGAKPEFIDPVAKRVVTKDQEYFYGTFINTSGLHADTVAHQFGVGRDYTLLPFKGLYWKLDPASGIKLNHLIYPVPDLRVPFLGVHTTTNTDGDVYFGPTAVPAFGRENYKLLEDVNIIEASKFLKLIGIQVLTGRQGFRRLAWQEGRRYMKPWFWQAAKSIVPRLKMTNLLPCDKVGIRAQMYHLPTGQLANDFVVEKAENSVHILNSISPAWTCSIPFAKMIVDQYIQ
jgi:(S)-2-hydroxyglutarate dehydrogenase